MFEKMKNSYFENTCTDAIKNEENQIIAYRITPDKGYMLHTIYHDKQIIDEETGIETGEKTTGYTDSYIVISSDYDFEENPYDIYAVKKETA